MDPQQFRIQTRDGRAQLAGQVDLPPRGSTARYPVVLMVPGGWFMDLRSVVVEHALKTRGQNRLFVPRQAV